MTLEDSGKIIDQNIFSIIFEYNRKDKFTEEIAGFPMNIIDTKYAVAYAPLIENYVIRENSYSVLPKVFGLLDSISLEAMGVERVQSIPRLGLKGQGVLLGFVDTGIDYTNPAFRKADGTTRILSIWDQTIVNPQPQEKLFYYGTEYNKEQIDDALLNENPYAIVPSTDEIGHGTIIAGIAGGSIDEANNFQGVVPEAEFVVVKLKKAKKNILDYFMIPDDVPSFQQDDIMLGITYLFNYAREVNRPIAICIGLGTNQGGHDSTSIMEDFLSYTGTHVGRAYIIAAGNEGDAKGHYYGEIDDVEGQSYNEVELNVGTEQKGFTFELWGNAPFTYSIDIMSPGGQYVPQIAARLGESREIDFPLENTKIYVDHYPFESQSGDPLIFIRFETPATGIWRFRVYAKGTGKPSFHIWLPMKEFISPDTYFINPNPFTTITIPGNALRNSTVTSYNATTGGIDINTSRGYTRLDAIIPDFAAPGVDVLAPKSGGGYVRASGTSIAAAHATGLAAMIFEWGIVKGNYQTLSSRQIERFLMRGVQGDPNIVYPDRTWGYGTLNIYQTFLSLTL